MSKEQKNHPLEHSSHMGKDSLKGIHEHFDVVGDKIFWGKIWLVIVLAIISVGIYSNFEEFIGLMKHLWSLI